MPNETAHPFAYMEHKNTPWVLPHAGSRKPLDICGAKALLRRNCTQNHSILAVRASLHCAFFKCVKEARSISRNLRT